MKYLELLVTLLLCASLQIPETSGADLPVSDDSIAEVGAFSDKVFVVRDGEKLHVSEGTKLRTGDRIITDAAGTVKLRHRDGSTMYIGTSSSLIIMAPMKFTLLEGTIKAEARGAFQIETHDILAITAPAEGGEFIVRQSSGGVEVMALSNDVSVGQTSVGRGMYAVLARGQSPVFRTIPDFQAAEMFPDVGAASSRTHAEEVAPLGFSAPDNGNPLDPAMGGSATRPSPSVP